MPLNGFGYRNALNTMPPVRHGDDKVCDNGVGAILAQRVDAMRADGDEVVAVARHGFPSSVGAG